MSTPDLTCTCGNSDLRVQAVIPVIVVSNPSELTLDIDDLDVDPTSVWAWCPDCGASTRDTSPLDATKRIAVKALNRACLMAELHEMQR